MLMLLQILSSHSLGHQSPLFTIYPYSLKNANTAYYQFTPGKGSQVVMSGVGGVLRGGPVKMSVCIIFIKMF